MKMSFTQRRNDAKKYRRCEKENYFEELLFVLANLICLLNEKKEALRPGDFARVFFSVISTVGCVVTHQKKRAC